ncbi:hypothetical protein AMJ49_01055 [Parcubacteria bacterium DG_74_2]|nr:MAG: hypothetical protein AMJ49_01055 [Parcubacteria bacterium DG_74_2]
MEVLKAIKNRRTIRLFKQKEIPKKIFQSCIDCAHLAPSSRNLQPLEYILVNDKNIREKIFDTLDWGGKLPEEKPDKNHKPTVYVIVISNKKINKKSGIDTGLAVANLVISAFSKGLGSCILGAINRNKIRSILKVPKNFEIKLVIALGFPAEKPKVEVAKKSVKYWRDKKGILHVPKRGLKKITHFNKF